MNKFLNNIEDGDITSLLLESLSNARKIADDARFEALLERIDLATEIIQEHDTPSIRNIC